MSILSNNTNQLQQIIDLLETKMGSVVGTWVFNEELNVQQPLDVMVNFTYVINDTTYEGVELYVDDGAHAISFIDKNGVDIMVYKSDAWCEYFGDEILSFDKSITILEEPNNSEFATWLKANAVRQPAPSDNPSLPTLNNPGTPEDLLLGKELIDGEGNIVEGTIVTKTSSNLTASGRTVTVPAGYYASQVQKTVSDLNLIASNIKQGVSIFGVTGTYGGITNYVPLMLQGKTLLNASLTNYNNTQGYAISAFTNTSVAGITYNYTDNLILPLTPELLTEGGTHTVTLEVKNLSPVLYVRVCIKVDARYAISSSNYSKTMYILGVVPPSSSRVLGSLNSIQHAGVVTLNPLQSTITTEYLYWSDTTIS